MRRIPRSLALAVGLALAGCAGASDKPDQEPADIRFVPGQGSVEALSENERAVARRAIAVLAEELDLDPGEILVDTVRAVNWPDSSIGCPQPDRAYLTVVTPGHKVTLRAQGRIHVVHEAKGNAFVCRRQKESTGITPQRELVFGKQLLEAQQDLARRLRVEVDEIKPYGAEGATWKDASLDCPEPGVEYAPGPVEGWVLTFRHGARSYTYHTDLARTIPCPPIATE